MRHMLDGGVVDSRLRRESLVTSVAILFSGSVLSQGLASVILLVTARTLGSAAYGQYTTCLVLTSFTSILFSLGLDIWLLNMGGRDPEDLHRYLGSVLVIKTVLGGLWYLLMYAVSPYLNGLLNSEAFEPRLVRVSAMSVWFDSAFATILVGYKARLENRMTSVIQVGSRAVWLLATFVAARLGVESVNVYAWIRMLVGLASFAVAAALVASSIGFRPRYSIILRALRESFPFAASEFLALASMRLDTLAIALVLNPRDVGLYAPVVGLVTACFMAPAAVYTVVVPILGRLYRSDLYQFWLLVRKILAALLILGSAMAVCAFAGSGLLIGLLGSSYGAADRLLRIMSIVLLLHSLTYGMAAVLVVTERQAQRVTVQAITVVVNALLSVCAAVAVGIVGVPWAYVASELVLLVGYACLVRQHYVRLRTREIQKETLWDAVS